MAWLDYVPTSPHFMAVGNVGAALCMEYQGGRSLPARMSLLGVFSQVVSRRLAILSVRRLAIHSGRRLD